MTSRTRTHRRDFLAGRSATEALLDATQGGDNSITAAGLPNPTERRGHLLQFARRAMATRFAVFLNAAEQDTGEAAVAALDVVDQVESQLTVYRDDSEVMHINRTAGHEPVSVDERLFELLSTCLTLFRDTGGAFDITAGPLMKVWGFFRRQGQVPMPDDLAAALGKVGSRHIRLDEPARTIEFAQRGLEINFGAIGKGYALDRAAEGLLAAGVSDFLLHGGKSSVLARGRHDAQPSESSGWLVGVGHPLRPEKQLAQIRLVDAALGTSSTTYQFFRDHGRRFGHILDPRTGWPAEGVLQCTVRAPTAALADALSTAFFVLGWDAAREYSNRQTEIAVLMALPADRAGAVRTEAVGFQPGELV
jgi:thiamine biosynthesis lipoprotein